MGWLSSAYLLNQSLFPRTFNPDILIVGGGIAGLNAAYTLQKQGLTVPVFEASNRVGGRMMTLNNYFENSKLYFQNWTKKEIDDKKDYFTEKKNMQ